ncbi:MAG: insulinase family protein [Ignavibacteriaceae bacterium]|nr:insulinase family protein [Ignavibacteriaceae bacterium]MCU0364589.1 insulinase family protein [Ignavibacteriaceae bacterium]MCU0406538.1 insulinase family protein [Ignavibacteriaceae bacterium]
MVIDRKQRPATSGNIYFTLPAVQTYQLSNGLKIYFSKKNELPLIRINFLVNSGSRFDPDELKGLSNLLAMCIDEGAGKYDALQLADEFEMLGAQFSVSSDPDVTVISLQVLSENFVPALNLLANVITEPHLKEIDFNREKRKVLARLEQAKAEPDYVAEITFEYFLFGSDSPYAFPTVGIESTVQKIQIESMRDLYQKKFSPFNSSVVVVGDIDLKSLQTELSEAFRDWNTKATIKEPLFNLKKSQRKIYIINKKDAVQTEIRTGHLSSKRSEKDFFQKQIMNLALGGQFSSRLNLNLREKNGYTYGIHSRFEYFKEAGHFAVSTSVDIENTTNALREIYSEINKIKDGITEVELEFAKSSLMKRYPANFETYRQITGNISSKIIHNLPDDYFETYIEKVNSVSLNEVNKVTFESIQPEELITLLVGDSKTILSQIIGDEFGEIVVLDFEDVFNK